MPSPLSALDILLLLLLLLQLVHLLLLQPVNFTLDTCQN
jgi:hypothetical protein